MDDPRASKTRCAAYSDAELSIFSETVWNERVLTGRTSRPIPSAGIIPNLRVDLLIAAAMVGDDEEGIEVTTSPHFTLS